MKKSNFNACNVLDVGLEQRRLWEFSINGSQVKLAREHTLPVTEALPEHAGSKSLFQKRLNIAWLPADKVFLRVIHLPAADIKELAAMVEFQLEKLSPFPVAQIVWSMELLRPAANGPQAVIVIIASRDAVEAFLGRLEADKYLADRLELPQVHQLLATQPAEDGAWIFPSRNGTQLLCLVAWWFGGTLQQVQLIHLPDGPEAPALLTAQLNQTAWAGEMEGWLTGSVRWHLLADPALASEWEPVLRQWSGAAGAVTAPPSRNSLAELAARRAAMGESHTNLLPPEHSLRYRQQFVDRLWMTGLGALVGAYILGVLVYFCVLFVMGWQKDRVVGQVRALSGSYTNSIRLKERIDVLQNQLDLKYAALDTFKAVSQHLPDGLTLTSFAFSKGRTVSLTGNAPSDQSEVLTQYARDLREAAVDEQKIFSNVPIPTWTLSPGAGGQMIRWTLNCELRRTDTE